MQLAKVIKIKSKKNRTGLLCFMLIWWNKESRTSTHYLCTRYVFIRCLFIIYQNDITDLHIYFSMFFWISKLFKCRSIACIPGLWNKASTYILCSTTYSPSQSVLTILVLKTWISLWPWKKSPKYGLQKAGWKKTGSLLFKKRRGQAASSLFE